MAEPARLGEDPWGTLTARESVLLKKAGERVFELSRRVAELERAVERLESELAGARELLAESREVRNVLVAQVTSLQTDLDREYDERSELRKLLASLHIQMQELLPVVTGLSKSYRDEGPPAVGATRPLPRGRRPPERRPRGLVSSATGELRRLAAGLPGANLRLKLRPSRGRWCL